jgi:hypothetical protein
MIPKIPSNDPGMAPFAVVVPIPGKGRGIRAAVALDAGQVIEVAPTVHLSADDCDRLESTALGDYYFAHPESDRDGLFVLGLTSVANHSFEPNADTEWRFEPAVGWQAVLRARRPIAAGEEITRRYRCVPWFDARP